MKFAKVIRFTYCAAPLAAALVVSVALTGCSEDSQRPTAAAPRAEPAQPVRAYEVARRDLSRRIQVSAPVQPLRTIDLAARTEGIVDEVNVEAGDRVEAGDVLARIDVSEQRAELARAEAALREAQATFDRLQRLRERDYIDEASFVTARSELDVARSNVELWKTRVEFGNIVAPIDAHVIARMVEPGAAVGRLAPAFELANLEDLVLRVGVSELDLAELEPGDEVDVRVDALAGEAPLQGVVRRIFPAAEGASRLITVEIMLPGAFERGVRPGYLARADVLVDFREDVLAVPAGSVGLGDRSYVMVIDENDELVKRGVSTGVIRGDWREITGGLQPGDRIVSSNPIDLAEGDSVRVVDTLTSEGA
ncbi:MAG: efflux RND transporter periplasmic adaptor subunit [Wenzhouxiangellaceae bacterium]|nr:efflux RND transporter periplasmic adaptor subunit [Wenzhouxiangellaceae bacterium]